MGLNRYFSPLVPLCKRILLGIGLFSIAALLSFSMGGLGGTAYAQGTPNLIIDKSVNNTTPDAGETFVYTIRYRCASVTAHCFDATIEDIVPAQLEIVGYSGVGGNVASASESGNTIIWGLESGTEPGRLDAGSAGLLRIRARFPACGTQDPADGTTLSNQATFSEATAGVISSAANGADLTVPTIPACLPDPPVTPPGFDKGSYNSVAMPGTGGLAAWLHFPANPSATEVYQGTDILPEGMYLMSVNGFNFTNAGGQQIDLLCDGVWYLDAMGVGLYQLRNGAETNCNTVQSLIVGAAYTDIDGIRGVMSPGGAASRLSMNFYISPDILPGTVLRNTGTFEEPAGVDVDGNGTPGETVGTTRDFAIVDPDPVFSATKRVAVRPGYLDKDGDSILDGNGDLPATVDSPDQFRAEDLNLSDVYLAETDTVWLVIGDYSRLNPEGNDIVDPVLYDDLPPEYEFVQDPTTGNFIQGQFLDSNQIPPAYDVYNNPACLNPTVTIIEDYNGTGSTRLKMEFIGCTLYGGQNSENRLAFYISARLKSGTPAGTEVTNRLRVSGSNNEQIRCFNDSKTTSDACGEAVSLTIPTLSTIESSKYVQGALDSGFHRFPSSGYTNLEGDAVYELTIDNVGNVDHTSMDVVDVLPYIGDTSLLSSDTRDSAWSEELAGPLVIERYDPNTDSWTTVPAGDLPLGPYYSSSTNPCRLDATGFELYVDETSAVGPAGCDANPWTGSAVAADGARSFGFRFAPSTPLGPGEKLRVTATVRQLTGEADANNGDIAWNSFAYGSTYNDPDTGLTTLLATEPLKVGVEMIDSSVSAAIGDYVWLDSNLNGIQETGEPPLAGVTVNLYGPDGTTPVLNSAGNPVTTKTDANGQYMFWGLTPSGTKPKVYVVRLDNPADYAPGGPLAGLSLTDADSSGDDATDSDAQLDGTDGYPYVTTPPVFAGTEVRTYDFGFIDPARVGNFVWDDLNEDGVQDADEPGVSGITVNLLDDEGTTVDTRTTDVYGRYLFTNVVPGLYSIQFTNIPVTRTFTTPNNSSSAVDDSDANSAGNTPQFVVPAGGIDMTWDAGLVPPIADPATITGRVWEDLDDDGLDNDGEPGVPNFTVQLLDDVGLPVRTTTTDSNGDYIFDNLPPDETYQVVFVPNTTQTISTNQDVPGDDTIDSDANPTTGETPAVTPTTNETIPNIDAGIISKLSLGNLVWYDGNNNGLVDAGESGIAGVTVWLLDSGNSIIMTTTTDSVGKYVFTGLDAGDYSVEVAVPAGHASSTDIGSTGTPNQLDSDDNGVDPTAATVRSAPITLVATGSTPGEASIGESDHGGIINSAIDTTPDVKAYYTVDFGFYQVVEIGNRVWIEDDGNGVADDSGDNTLPFIDVSVTATAADGSTTYTATTDANGFYTITVPANAVYTVTVEAPSLYIPSTRLVTGTDSDSNLYNNQNHNSAGALVSVRTENNYTIDFGYVRIESDFGDLPDVYGTVVNSTVITPAVHIITDTLHFGTLVDSEADGVPSVNADGDDTALTPDDEDGIVFMTPFMPGTTAVISVTAYVSDAVGTAYYGAWLDIDGSGSFEPGEFFDGTLVNSGTPTVSTTINVPIGASDVVSDTIYSRFRIAAEQSEIDELSEFVGVASTGEVEDYVLMSLGNQVWFDTDNSGVLDGSEVGVGSGVALELYNDEGERVATTTTDANGYYTFTGLISDTYTVIVTSTNFIVNGPLENYLSSTGATSGTNENDNGNDPATLADYLTNGVASDPVLLNYGSAPDNATDGNGTNSDLTVDFGFYQISLGNTVWEDYNNDGDIDAGEPGIENVEVRLLDGVTNAVILTTTTDASGIYTFTGLISDTYKVEIVPLAGYVSSTGTNQEADPDSGGDQNDNGPDVLVAGAIRSAEFSLTPGDDSPTNSVVNDAEGSTVNPTVDFGLYQPLALGNQVWFDTDNNGQIDGGEVGVSDVDVELYRDSNDDGVFTPGVDVYVDSVATIAGGYYTFTDLISGTYVVVITDTNFSGAGALVDYQSSDPNEADPDSNGDDNDNGLVSGTLGSGGYVSSAAIALSPNDEPDGAPDVDGDNDDNTNWTVDFGFYSMSLGNVVWEDYNNNGIQDVGEPGINAVSVALVDENGVVVDTTTTNADGYYTFTGVISGAYVVSVTTPSAAFVSSEIDGGDSDSDDDPDTDTDDLDDNGIGNGSGEVASDPITLTPGDAGNGSTINNADGSTQNTRLDFGLFRSLALGNQVWFDTDNDGQIDGSEVGISGVAVELYRDSDDDGVFTPGVDTFVDSLTTIVGGYYTFTGLISDTYVVVITDTNFSGAGALVDYQSSDPNEADPDSNGDDNDNGLVTDTLGSGGYVSSAAIDLAPGDEPNEGGDANWTVDFGFYQLSVGNVVWEDYNNNGLQDVGEPGLSGLTVTLVDDATGNTLNSTTTDSSGYYSFTNLIAGSYRFSVTLPNGYLVSTGAGQESDPNSNGDGNDNGLDVVSSATVGSNAVILTPGNAGAATNNIVDNAAGATFDPTVDFGLYRPVNLGNQVWYDVDNNGLLDAGEEGIENVAVELFLDSNGNGIFDAADSFVDNTTTNATGHYTFTDLLPTVGVTSTYLVVITDTNFSGVLTNYQSSLDDTTAPDPDNNIDNDDNGTPISLLGVVASSPISLTVGSEPNTTTNVNDSNWTVDFGFVQFDYGDLPTSYNTDNANTNAITPAHHTIIDGLHLGASVDAELDGQPSTDADGDDANGDDENGVTFVTNPLGSATLLAGQPFTLTVEASTAGYLNAWFDWNNDGDLADADEHPFADTALLTGNNTLVLTVPNGVTADEIYSRFRFSSDNPAGSMGPDGFWPNGEVEDYVTPAIERFSLGNRVWDDLDNDGLLDANESGLQSVLVNLLNITGTVIASTTTDVDGYYLFDELPTGDYMVEIDAANFGTGQPLADFLSSTGAGQEADPNSDGESNDNGLDTPVSSAIRSGVVTLTSAAGGEPTAGDGEIDVDPNSGGVNSHGTATDLYSNLTVDFGFFQPVSVGDFVWFDDDADGIQDVGESGVPTVTVTLYDAEGNLVSTDANGDSVAPIRTDANGEYLFANLLPGSYSVQFDLTTLPAGYLPTQANVASAADSEDSDADPTTGATDLTSFIPSGGENLTLDMGIYYPVSVGDRVWFDDNRNGIQDAGEDGVPGITVTVYDDVTGNPVTVDAVGSPVLPVQTDADGNYSFDGLEPGDYYVVFDLTTLPTGYQVTQQDAGSDDTLDSDADPTTGQTAPTGVLNATTSLADPSLDMGIVGHVAVGDYVWEDLNGNGIQEPNEPGIEGVSVMLYSVNDQPVVDSSGNSLIELTDANGAYTFRDLLPGDYYVVFSDLPPGYAITDEDVNGNTLNANDSDVNPITLATESTGYISATLSNLTLDMGMVRPVTVGDYVWNDLNGDGIQDADEPGILGVIATVYDNVTKTPVTTDIFGNPLGAVVTDADGNYLIENLHPGDYYVVFSNLPMGFVVTDRDAGSDDAADSDVNPSTLQTSSTGFLSSNEVDLTLDMGLVRPVTIGGFVWYDDDADGMQDGDDAGVENVTVTLYDADGTAVTSDLSGNPVVPIHTNINGEYLFENLHPGDYYVQFDLSSLPMGYVVTIPNQGDDDELDSDASVSNGSTGSTGFILGGGENLTLDMGIIRLTGARVGDFIWEDLNGNGIQDAGEPGISGVTVALYDNVTGQPVTDDSSNPLLTTTDGDGFYLFDELPSGDYYVVFSNLPPGYVVTLQNIGNDDATDSDISPINFQTDPTGPLENDAQDLSLDMGLYQPASIGDTVWLDVDADGIQEPGEPGIANVTVRLYGSGGTLIATTTTNANGKYTFTGLAPGNYYIEIVPPTDYGISSLNVGNNEAMDSDIDPATFLSVVTTLTSGENDSTWDAGLYQDAAIGDYVWLDINGNGIQDANEEPLAEVTVHLYNGDGQRIATTTTDEYGRYGFTGLVPGDYSVGFVTPNKLIPTKANQGSDGTRNSDADPKTGRTAIATLDSMELDPTWDAGFTLPASVGNYVWFDTNKDGIKDNNEPGVAGVTVSLLDETREVVQETVTDDAGFYQFDNLPPGIYQLQFSKPENFDFTQQGAERGEFFNSDVNQSSGITPIITLDPGENEPDWGAGLVATPTALDEIAEPDSRRNLFPEIYLPLMQ